jgi:hypothetical protein
MHSPRHSADPENRTDSIIPSASGPDNPRAGNAAEAQPGNPSGMSGPVWGPVKSWIRTTAISAAETGMPAAARGPIAKRKGQGRDQLRRFLRIALA